MTETARLVIAVDSRAAKSATGDLDKLAGGAGKAEKATGALTGAWKALTAVAASAALANAVGTYVRLADASANMAARLRLATDGTESFNKAQADTFAIAQRTATELDSVVNLYARLAQSSTELGLSQEQVTRLTQTVTEAFQISGATAQEASGGIRQLTQAIAGGTLRAEEFNSIIESSPRIVQALADHFGVSFGKVRQLVNDGKVSSQEFAQALLNASDTIGAEFDQMPLTVGRASQQVRNALTALIGDVDEAEGASRGLAEAISGMADVLGSERTKEAFGVVVQGLTSFITAASDAIGYATRVGAAMTVLRTSMAETELAGQRFTPFAGIRSMVDGGGYMDPYAAIEAQRASLAAERAAAMAVLRGEQPSQANAPHPGIDFTRGAPVAPGGSGSAASGIRERASASREATEADAAWLQMMEEVEAHEAHAAASRMERTNELLRQAEAEEEAREQAAQGVRDLISDMEFERSLIGMTNVQREQAIALRYAGAAATQEERDRIRELVAEMEQAREAEGYVMDAKRGLGDLFATIGQGSDAATAAIDRMFDRLKQRAMDALADKAIDSLMAGVAGMMGGGGWAGFAQGFAGAWSGVKSGKAFGGPVQAGHAYRVGERGEPELFVPNTSGRVVPMGQGGMQRPVINLNVIGGQGTPETRTTPNAQGGFDIDVIFKQIEGHIAGGIASGSGSTYAAVKGRFALRDAV